MTEGNTEGMTQDNTRHEDADFNFGWEMDGLDDEPQPHVLDDPTLPVLLTADLIPLDRGRIVCPESSGGRRDAALLRRCRYCGRTKLR